MFLLVRIASAMKLTYPKLKSPMTEKNLRELFQWLNKTYFHSQVAEPLEFKWCDGKRCAAKGSDAHSGYKSRKEDYVTFVHVHPDFRNHQVVTQTAMLHEMVHCKLPSQKTDQAQHGWNFGAEIVRLFEIGAYQDLL